MRCSRDGLKWKWREESNMTEVTGEGGPDKQLYASGKKPSPLLGMTDYVPDSTGASICTYYLILPPPR